MKNYSPVEISVCIANYNGAGFIDGCIESVLAQIVDASVEIIVHDDASTDISLAIIQKNYPEILVLESRENVGFCIANNRMVEKAKGEFVLLLNNDAELMPGALQALLDAARLDERPKIISLPQYDAQNGELIDRGCLLDPFFNPVPNTRDNRQVVGMVIGACLWVPSALWFEIEGFPEWFHSIGEDLYLCSCARLFGCDIEVLQVSGYRHKVGASFGGGKPDFERSLSTNIRRRSLSECNKTYTMLICEPLLPLLFIFPVHLIFLITEGVLLSLLKRNSIILKNVYLAVFVSLWVRRREVFLLRKKVQSRRKISLHAWFSCFVIFPWKLRMLFEYGVPKIE